MRRRSRGRVVRSAVIAAFSAHFALAFHVLGGGAVPQLPGMALVLALSMVACLALDGRRHSLVRISAAVAASQFLFHFLLAAAALTVSVHAEGHHAQTLVVDAAAASAGHPPMWGGHAMAAALTIAFIHYFDAVSSGAANLVRALAPPILLLLLRIAILPAPRRAVPADSLAVVFRPRMVLSVSPRRGPPPAADFFSRRLPA